MGQECPQKKSTSLSITEHVVEIREGKKFWSITIPLERGDHSFDEIAELIRKKNPEAADAFLRNMRGKT